MKAQSTNKTANSAQSVSFGEAQVQRALEEQNCANSPALQF